MIARQCLTGIDHHLLLACQVRQIERQDVLLEQELSVGEQTGRVRDILESESMKVGGRIELIHFVRWKVGDGLEKPVTDFAAEVEKELQRSSKH